MACQDVSYRGATRYASALQQGAARQTISAARYVCRLLRRCRCLDSHPRVRRLRHHGPGSAWSVLKALKAPQPDIILVEGHRMLRRLLPLLTHAEMEPPVATSPYVPEEPAAPYRIPLPLFSPEWQALRYGLTRHSTRFIDLPQAHQLAMRGGCGAAGSEAVEDESDPVAPARARGGGAPGSVGLAGSGGGRL